ncbi:hypothetical protein [Roseobacter sp.]|uniref:hypothetical protein n=1 Tax=Roseobacter sp. TaxID=1907202 RepID=UPI003298E4C6
MKRILVVGRGLIGIRHLWAVAAHPGCALVGLADTNLSLAPDVPRLADMADVPRPVDGAAPLIGVVDVKPTLDIARQIENQLTVTKQRAADCAASFS